MAPVRGEVQHVERLEQAPLVHADERGLVDEVAAVDRMLVDTHVADGGAARLLRVVDEVRLHTHVGVAADDLRGVLVGADGAVGAEAVEHGPHLGAVGAELGIPRQAGVADVVVDAHGERVLRRVAAAASSNTAFTIAGVNSLLLRP